MLFRTAPGDPALSSVGTSGGVLAGSGTGRELLGLQEGTASCATMPAPRRGTSFPGSSGLLQPQGRGLASSSTPSHRVAPRENPTSQRDWAFPRGLAGCVSGDTSARPQERHLTDLVTAELWPPVPPAPPHSAKPLPPLLWGAAVSDRKSNPVFRAGGSVGTTRCPYTRGQ